MKKLILFLIIATFFSCGSETHSTYPLIVEEVTSNFAPCVGKETKYRLTVKNRHYDDKVYIFTDSLFQVGDTIK